MTKTPCRTHLQLMMNLLPLYVGIARADDQLTLPSSHLCNHSFCNPLTFAILLVFYYHANYIQQKRRLSYSLVVREISHHFVFLKA